MAASDTLVTFELFRVPAARVPAAIARMASDRVRLRRTPGARFVKLLGTGDGETFDLRDVDARTWAVLVVWDHPLAATAYARRSPVAGGWRALAEEAWRAELRPLACRGRWSGVEPFGGPASGGWRGPVAAITRARLSWPRMLRFWRAVQPVSADLRHVDGLRLSVGIGEAPVGLQGTFSIWDDAVALTDFAYRRSAHRTVVEATPLEGWYREELFARFAVERSSGTIFGSNPLAGIDAHPPGQSPGQVSRRSS